MPQLFAAIFDEKFALKLGKSPSRKLQIINTGSDELTIVIDE